jgi:hypothetical protein
VRSSSRPRATRSPPLTLPLPRQLQGFRARPGRRPLRLPPALVRVRLQSRRAQSSPSPPRHRSSGLLLRAPRAQRSRQRPQRHCRTVQFSHPPRHRSSGLLSRAPRGSAQSTAVTAALQDSEVQPPAAPSIERSALEGAAGSAEQNNDSAAARATAPEGTAAQGAAAAQQTTDTPRKDDDGTTPWSNFAATIRRTDSAYLETLCRHWRLDSRSWCYDKTCDNIDVEGFKDMIIEEVASRCGPVEKL